MSIDLFEMVARRELTPEEAVDIMIFERRLSEPLWLQFLCAFPRWLTRVLP